MHCPSVILELSIQIILAKTTGYEAPLCAIVSNPLLFQPNILLSTSSQTPSAYVLPLA
jgi:hypothetical protein